MAAEADPSQAQARVPRAHGDEGRARGARSKACPRSTAPVSLIPTTVRPEGQHQTERRAQWLRRSQDFRVVMQSGRRSRHALLHVAVRDNELSGSRVGFSVGRRVGNAVARNRVKRRLRAIMRDLPVRPGVDIVAVAHDQSADATYAVLREATIRCLMQTGALGRVEA